MKYRIGEDKTSFLLKDTVAKTDSQTDAETHTDRQIDRQEGNTQAYRSIEEKADKRHRPRINTESAKTRPAFF